MLELLERNVQMGPYGETQKFAYMHYVRCVRRVRRAVGTTPQLA
jgi:hypothetical protein